MENGSKTQLITQLITKFYISHKTLFCSIFIDEVCFLFQFVAKLKSVSFPIEASNMEGLHFDVASHVAPRQTFHNEN